MLLVVEHGPAVRCFVPFIFFEANVFTSLIDVVLFGAGAGIDQQSLFQLWSGELFPTLLRYTAQGSCSASCGSRSAAGC